MVLSALMWIDALVLHTTERLCHLWQRLTGRTNIWLAVQLTNLSIVVYFMWAGVEIWTNDWPVRLALGALCGVLIYALTKTVFRVPIESSEASAYKRVMTGHRNPRRVRDVPLRLPFLGLTVLLAYPSVLLYRHLAIRPFSYMLVVLTTAGLYLLACDPLPPGGSKVSGWSAGFSLLKLRRAPVPPTSRPRFLKMSADGCSVLAAERSCTKAESSAPA